MILQFYIVFCILYIVFYMFSQQLQNPVICKWWTSQIWKYCKENFYVLLQTFCRLFNLPLPALGVESLKQCCCCSLKSFDFKAWTADCCLWRRLCDCKQIKTKVGQVVLFAIKKYCCAMVIVFTWDNRTSAWHAIVRKLKILYFQLTEFTG